MTRPRGSAYSVENVRSLLRGAGMRCTAARIAVIQSLSDSEAPLSMNNVVDDLAEFGFDKSTIYRTLIDLEQASLVAMLELGNSSRRFELTPFPESDGGTHPHFLCTECGKLICLPGFHVNVTPDDNLQDLPGELTEVLLKGRCDSCS
ncbi:Fur family transcriptional regulator [Blastopirellula retiformator]|uniref:Ferric uptake regulation protein n=1 Tax=Blastopirellula retiformator TaxID=2527970 RepID=A0A5C5V7V0_9BACT|nr:transcriptional repressor [Blastopirellula retiformator]TWT34606.1 Ferric uptake regulation protein [Blastopirellula retiformator]